MLSQLLQQTLTPSQHPKPHAAHVRRHYLQPPVTLSATQLKAAAKDRVIAALQVEAMTLPELARMTRMRKESLRVTLQPMLESAEIESEIIGKATLYALPEEA